MFLWFMLELAVKKELTSFVLKALQVLVDQSKKANSPLKGHERTVQYLQHLGECGKEQYFCEVFILVWLGGYSIVWQLSGGFQAEKVPFLFILVSCIMQPSSISSRDSSSVETNILLENISYF